MNILAGILIGVANESLTAIAISSLLYGFVWVLYQGVKGMMPTGVSKTLRFVLVEFVVAFTTSLLFAAITWGVRISLFR